MSDLRNIALAMGVFSFALLLALPFYNGVLLGASKTPVEIDDQFINNSFIQSITTAAVNQTQNTQQPSTPSPLDFFFSLPALFLQATTGGPLARGILGGAV